MALGDIAYPGHRVGLVVGAVDPDPSTLAAHDHGLVLAEARYVSGDDRTPGTFERSLLRGLDPLGQDQRVIGITPWMLSSSAL
jgi:hypothetical protein